MLIKLMKQEMKACSRLILPLFFILIVLTVLDRLVLGLTIFVGILGIIPGIITILYILAMFAIIILCSVIVIVRFYKNLITDEGYLMFTLPVKPSQLINSKLIVASFWVLFCIITAIASIYLVFGTLNSADLFWLTLKSDWAGLRQELGSAYVTLLLGGSLGIFFCIICQILQVYASIALGQLFTGHRILGSVVAFAATTTIMQIICTIIPIVFLFISHIDINSIEAIINLMIPVALALAIAFSAVFYWITHYIFKSKLNLE